MGPGKADGVRAEGDGDSFDEPDSEVFLTGLNLFLTWRSLLSEEGIEYCRWKKQQILDGNITYRIYTEID